MAGVPAVPATDTAKHWLIELLAASPLSRAGEVPVADLARDAPELCSAIVHAIGSDQAFQELERSPLPASIPRLTGATDVAAVVAAVDALRRVLLRTIMAASPLPEPAYATEVSDRLASICFSILGQSVIGVAGTGGTSPPVTEPQIDSGEPLRFARRQAGPATEATPPAEPAASRNGSDAVAPAGSGSARDIIVMRTERARAAGQPVGLLTVEIDDLDRLVASASGMEVATALEAAERAVAGALSAGDDLCRVRLGHHWVVTSEGDPVLLRDLGERLAAAISQAASLAGAPLTASVGIASFPRDGEDVDEVIVRADERLFAARAAGVRLA